MFLQNMRYHEKLKTLKTLKSYKSYEQEPFNKQIFNVVNDITNIVYSQLREQKKLFQTCNHISKNSQITTNAAFYYNYQLFDEQTSKNYYLLFSAIFLDLENLFSTNKKIIEKKTDTIISSQEKPVFYDIALPVKQVIESMI